jgi:hypothetical protein
MKAQSWTCKTKIIEKLNVHPRSSLWGKLENPVSKKVMVHLLFFGMTTEDLAKPIYCKSGI